MNKKILTFLLFILPSTLLFAQDINWMTWEEAIEQRNKDTEAYTKAKEAGEQAIPPKKMFIDFYTDWCGWCKRMDATTFKDPSVVQIMNQYFYPVKFDAERSDSIVFNNHTFVNPNPGKSRSTHQFAASILDYELSYPSYVLLDENLGRTTIYRGFMQPDDVLGILLFFGKNQHLPYQKSLKQQFNAEQAQ